MRGGRRGPDRAWWAWVDQRGERRIRIYLVERGVRTTETLPREATEREADRRVKILQAALSRGDLQAPLDWQELVDRFLEDRDERGCRPATLDAYKHHIGSVARVFETADPLALTERDAETYKRTLEAEGRSAATIVRGLDAMAIVQRWCVDQGWCRAATWEAARRPEILHSRAHLQPDQVGAFVRAAQRLEATPPGKARRKDWARWEAAVWLLLHGLRTSEAVHLRVADIDLLAGVVTIADRAGARTKSASSARTVPVLSELALGCLRETFRGADGGEPAFPCGKREKGNMRAEGAGRSKWFSRRVKATCEEAKIIPPVTPHGLRHSVATAAVIAGADMHSLQALLGHADARITARVYAHATSAQRARAAATVVGSWLDRVVQARPGLQVVR